MEKKTTGKLLCSALKIITGLVCTFLFVANTREIFNLFIQNHSTIATSHIIPEEGYEMPAIVFCSKRAYKNPNATMLSLLAYEENTIDPWSYVRNVTMSNTDIVI